MMDVTIQRRKSITIKINEADILRFINSEGVIDGKLVRSCIAVQIPGGGDWSNMMLEVHDLADGCITVTCDVEEGS